MACSTIRMAEMTLEDASLKSKKIDVRSRQNVSQGKNRAREEVFSAGLLGSQIGSGVPLTPPI
ncbi:hypothetical protein PPUJ20005_39310 [Pseudomonas putida]|nr:hypothetical protein PPUJ20005_39310 [Pseudomonas putida]